MLVDEIIRLLDHVKAIKDNDTNKGPRHPRRQSWFAASWGSFVFHVGLWTYAEADPEINVTALAGVLFRDIAITVLPLYSAVFGVIVAFGNPRGSLIRHFAYGVLMPVFAYGLAGTLLDLSTTGLNLTSEE